MAAAAAASEGHCPPRTWAAAAAAAAAVTVGGLAETRMENRAPRVAAAATLNLPASGPAMCSAHVMR